MKSLPLEKYNKGTPHQAARGYVALWGTIMAAEKPEQNTINFSIGRNLIRDIDQDERRKDQGEEHFLNWENISAQPQKKEPAKQPEKTKSSLPPTAQVVADVIGIKAALALSMSCQHRCVYVPHGRLASDSYLVVTIGRELAERLQRQFSGMLLPMATCQSTKQALIRDKMLQLKSQTQQQPNANS